MQTTLRSIWDIYNNRSFYKRYSSSPEVPSKKTNKHTTVIASLQMKMQPVSIRHPNNLRYLVYLTYIIFILSILFYIGGDVSLSHILFPISRTSCFISDRDIKTILLKSTSTNMGYIRCFNNTSFVAIFRSWKLDSFTDRTS